MDQKKTSFALILVVLGITGLGVLALSGRRAPTGKFDSPVAGNDRLSEEFLEDLDRYLVQVMEEYEVPGTAMVLVRGDQVAYSRGHGVRDLDTREPVTTETLFGIGSTTKTMTAVMVAALVDAGIIAWDTPVTEILPEFSLSDPKRTDQVTMEHTLCMCTGVPRRMEEISVRYSEMTAEDVIESLADIRLQGRFGADFNYSSRMLSAGGYLAALAAGGSYGSLADAYMQIMQDRLLDPLGMSGSTFSIQKARESGNYATPYYTGLAGMHPTSLEIEGVFTPIAPAGALWSNAEDMARYLQMLLNDGVSVEGRRIVSPESLHDLWQPRTTQEPGLQYGLGWNIEEYNGLTILHHPGGTVGFSSEMAIIPELDLGFVLLTNKLDMTAPAGRLVYYRLLEMLTGSDQVYEDTLGDAKREIDIQILGLKALTKKTVDPETYAPYLGRYSNDTLGEAELVVHQDETLWLDIGEYEIPLHPLRSSENELIFFESLWIGKTLRLEKDAAGNPEMSFTGDEGNTYTFKPGP